MSSKSLFPRMFDPVFLVVVGASFLGCAKSTPSFEQQAHALQGLSVPSQGRLLDVSRIEQGPLSVVMGWGIEVPDQSWQIYAQGLVARLQGQGFRQRKSTETALDFVRSAAGDAYVLRVEVASPGPPLRLRLKFTAMAD